MEKIDREKNLSAGSIMDSTMSCGVTERDSPLALSQTSRGQRGNRERLGTRLG